MNTQRSNSLAQAIAANPWASLQDVLLLSGGMIIAVVLALEYDLFRYQDQLTSEERTITLAELLALTALLAMGICGFIARRFHELRSEAARLAYRSLEMQELREQTQRDPTTGLLNHRGLLSALASAIAAADGSAHQQALFLLGLKGIERVNDVEGRAVGDRALRIAAQRFRAAARPQDIMAKLEGGSEFALLAPDLDRDGARALGERLIASLRTDVVAGQVPQRIGVSIGATMIDGPIPTAAEILNAADLAMRRAKEEHQPALVFYDDADASPGP